MTTAIPLDSIAFPLFGTRLIEASAGTGKTYTIAALYVRLILGHPNNFETPRRDLLPPDILVVTFTEAATKELRDRIRDRLSQTARFFREQAVKSDDFLVAIRAAHDESAWPACARRLELAANWMDEAAVYTIHSWCNRMLQQHAFDSGSLLRQDVNTDDTELLNEVVRDYWRTFFYPLSETVTRAVSNLIRSPEDLAASLNSLLAETEAEGLQFDGDIHAAFQTWETWENQRQTLERTGRRLWLEEQDALNALLNEASGKGWLNGTRYPKKSFADYLAKMSAWAAGGNEKLGFLEKFSQAKLHSALVKAHRNKTDALEHPAFSAIDRLLAHAFEELDLNKTIVLHAVHWIRTRYHNEKQRLARMTFNDMLTRLDIALQGDNGRRLADAIRRQHPVALIDEFQDTDPIQYRIFSTLYPSDADSDSGLGCFMIGDPKQAIYSFRGADIFTYLKAHQDTKTRHYTLDTNYRSTKDLVAAVNQAFLQADRQANGAFLFRSETEDPLPFYAVNAQGRDDVWVIDNEPASALTLWRPLTPDPVGMSEYYATMAAAAASEIVRLLNAANSGRTGFKSADGVKPLQPSDIAILVRTGREAKIMRDALAKRRTRSVYLSERDSIFASAEAADLLRWLQAMADPRNERRVRTALSTATFGWPHPTLKALAQDEPAWEQQLERFLSYQQRWRQDGVLPALRQLLNDYELHARLSEDPNGERCLTNLLHLAELLQQASMQIEGEQALIRYLAENIEARQGSSEEHIVRLESDANLIKIITIHKSKGLEYPLVFLPFICSFREVSSQCSDYYRYHDEQRNLRIDLDKNEASRLLSDQERLQEDVRLLYVAMTRARYACWLGIAPVKSGKVKTCQLEKSGMGVLLNWQAGMEAAALDQQLRQLKGDCPTIAIAELPDISDAPYQAPQATEERQAVRTATTKIADNWWIASYSALSIAEQGVIQGEPAQEPETARDDKQLDETELPLAAQAQPHTGIHGLPRGAGPGVLIHELLEHCADLGFAKARAQPEKCMALIQERFSDKVWRHQHDIIASALSSWLTMPLLPATDISLAQLNEGDYQAELEFLIGADHVEASSLDRLVTRHTFQGKARPKLQAKHVNGLLKGFIDLVFVHQRQYYVVDYKFNSLGNCDANYTQEALTAAMLNKRYDVQYSLYLLALHRLLKSRLGGAYDYDRHIGGGLYLFLRGYQGAAGGRLFNKPPKALIAGLDALFSASAPHGEPA